MKNNPDFLKEIKELCSQVNQDNNQCIVLVPTSIGWDIYKISTNCVFTAIKLNELEKEYKEAYNGL